MEQYKSRHNSITILINEFCNKKLDGRCFKIALKLIHTIEENEFSSSMERNPEIWAAAIMKIVLTSKRREPNYLKPKISIREINEFFGTKNSLTIKVTAQIKEILPLAYPEKTLRNMKMRRSMDSSTSQRRKIVRKMGFKRIIGHYSMMESLNLPTTPTEKKVDYIKYEVLYGTNRTINLKSKQIKFNNIRDNILHLGLCEISIPQTHKMGNLERPSWFKNLIFEESPEEYFTLLSNKNIDETEFLKVLKQKVGQSEEQDVLLFIHGFNVKFDEAMLRTAQLGYDLNFKGGVSAFSWPSKGSISGYVADTDSARLSTDYLCNFIKLLVNGNVKKLHIIAHSMGNIVLSEALMQLRREDFFPNLIINQIILAAPDIDKDIFIQQIMPTIRGIARLTLYASDKDKALVTSRKIRNNYFRLGEGGENIVVVDGIESVDASYVDTNLLGHGYFADTQSLLNDIHMVFLGLSPDQRILDAKSKIIEGKSLIYWAFRNS
jgi:esterase/lipase superfamily enzyme